MKRFFALASLIALVACNGGSASGPPPSSPSPLLGKPAPTFQRASVNGPPIAIASSGGRVTVVKFMAKYCEPCVRTLPAIEKLHVDHPEIAFVGISEDEHESATRELVATYGLTFPVVHDAQQVLAARYRVRDLPVTYVLDGHGNVVWVGGPEKTETELVAGIDAVKP